VNRSQDIRQRGAYLLPNALTTGALFAGCYSIIAGINGQFEAAAVAIGVAALLDGLDGRVARLTNTQSEFGIQYDSLADLVSFGIAPALLAYTFALKDLGDLSATAGKLGWLGTFVYIACAALRLARFNAQSGSHDRRYFQGLASPAAALSLATTVWFFVDRGIAPGAVHWLIWLVTVLLGLLMFSRVRYYSFKTVGTAEKVPIAFIFGVMLALVLFALDPPAVGVLIGIIYISSGILVTLLGRRARLERRALRRLRRRGKLARREIGPHHDAKGRGERETGT
jgi:CDP-diacylglycerol--serine O-phosphatidyltransferase